MTISIIGSGNVATFYATTLWANGVAIHQVFSPNSVHAEALASKVAAQAICTLDALSSDVDAFIIAVADDAFQTIAQAEILKDKMLIHCSGTQSIHTFQSLSARCGVIWPVYSIRKNDLPSVHNIPLVIDYCNDEGVISQVENIAHLISNNVTYLNDEQRKYLHLNAVLVNNFSNHLLSMVEQICQEQRLPYDILVPIIQQGFKDVALGDFKAKQTGPAIRKDSSTITKHEEMLATHPEWLHVYQALTASILKDA